MANFSALKTAIQNAIKQNGNEEITGDVLQQILLSVVNTMGDGAINTIEQNLSNETLARQGADNTLQQNINSEAGARQSADNSLQSNIDAEALARGNADTQLQNAINAIKADIDNGYVYAGIAAPSSTPVSGKVFYIATAAGTYTNFGGQVLTQGINILRFNGSAWSNQQLIGIDDVPTAGSNSLVKSGGVQNELALGAVYDVSAKNPTGGPNSDGKWESLSALLSDANLNTLIPTAYRKGGMSIKFVQSSDNKYVKFFCNSLNFTTDVSKWQGVDDTPVLNSKNLVESNGLYNRIGVIDKSIEWIKPNWYSFNVGAEPVEHTDTSGHYQSTYFKVLKGDKVKVIGNHPSSQPNNYAVTGLDNIIISRGGTTTSAITEVIINNDGYFYFWANYDEVMGISLIRDEESIIHNIESDISAIKEYIHIKDVGTITEATNVIYVAHSAIVSVVSGSCTISSRNAGGVQQTHYPYAGAGLYFVKRENEDLAVIRFTDLDPSATIIIYYCNKTEYEWFLKQIADDSRSVTALANNVTTLTKSVNTIFNDFARTTPLHSASNISASTNIGLYDYTPLLVVVEVISTGTCSINSWGDVGSQMTHYSNVGAGKYIVKRPNGNISNIRITDLSATSTINVYGIPSNLVDVIAILYDDYTNLNYGLDERIDAIAENVVDSRLFDRQFVDYSDSYYDSIGKYIASYKLSNDYLANPYFNRKLATKDSLVNSAGKTCYYNGYLYVLKYQNHLASGNGESEYLHLVKVSTSDNTDYADIIAFDVDEVLTFQDSTTITIVKAHEGCLNVNVNGIDVCTYIEYLDNGNTKYQMVHKHFNHSLVEQSVSKCSLIYDSQTYNFAHDDVPTFMQGTHYDIVFNAGLAYDGTYYCGAWSEKMMHGTYILRTTDFITWNYVFEVPQKYIPYGEVGMIFSTDGDYLYCAVRCARRGTYIVRVKKSDWSIIEDMWIKGDSSMGTFFKFDNKIYAFVNNDNRLYYRIITIDEKTMTNGHIICDTNNTLFGPNTTISTDGSYLYGCITGVNLQIVKFVIPIIQHSECDNILAGLLNT